jgi:hypothetical protein
LRVLELARGAARVGRGATAEHLHRTLAENLLELLQQSLLALDGALALPVGSRVVQNA